MPRPSEAAKAITAAVVAGLTYLQGIVGADTSVSEAFAAMGAAEWIGLGLAVLGSFGVVYAIPNKNYTKTTELSVELEPEATTPTFDA